MANEELTMVFAGTEADVSGVPLAEVPLPEVPLVEVPPVEVPLVEVPLDAAAVSAEAVVPVAVALVVPASASRPLARLTPPPPPPPPPPHPASAPAATVSKIVLLSRTFFNKKNLRDINLRVCTWEGSYRANVLAFSFPMFFTLPLVVLHR
jgi:hypothetical protein